MIEVSGSKIKDDRVSEKQAGYMELAGAEKDADCEKVKVPGGVSAKLGCCNYFEPESKSVTEFRCGTCSYVEAE